ncbi:MAG: N-acetylmuramoyl-L-alanine amidase [Polyangiaceae bacterium]|nr:N-acetylmuramoyl-L-alanine amidase [Polyangiaceae bacterium]
MSSRATLRSLLVLSLLGAAGCAAGADRSDAPPGDAVETLPEGTSLDAIIGRAAHEHGVPESLLKAIAWAETHAQMVAGDEEHEGQAPARGVMALRGDQVVRGAALVGLTEAEVESEPEPNVRAAAALLGELADELGIDRENLGAWAPVVAAQSGIESLEGRIGWVHDEVYATLRDGVAIEGFTLEASDVLPAYPLMDGSPTPGPDYAGSVWRPSPNYSSRAAGNPGVPQMVIIHTCEGAYSGCWGWLTNPSSSVSAHYVVNSTGSEISELVRESKKAWHIGATYDCSLNSGKECDVSGYGANNFTIGIEHAGYASQASWNAGLLDASAALVCNITKDQAIPLDKYHVVGHGQLQPYNRVDPGANWPWAQYLGLASQKCGAVQPPPPPPPPPGDATTIVIDSNQAANGPNAAIEVGSNWTASTNVAGYYNTGYWWRSTGASSDLAKFKAYLPSAKKMAVEAWWPAASDRAPEAPFIIYDGNGNQLDTVLVNQQQNGGKWVTLGTYNLTAGWNVVALSRWTTAGYVVVADAVRLRAVP